MRYVTGVVILIAASMACSRGNERAVSALPTSPTATAETTIAYVGGVSGPMDVLFPGRNESFQFRQALETSRRSSSRASLSFRLSRRRGCGMQEYIRYVHTLRSRDGDCARPTMMIVRRRGIFGRRAA